MKLLALSDLHADEDLLDRLRAIAARNAYDYVLFCGDLTTRGPVSYATEALSLFPKNSFCIHGNMDTPDVIEAMKKHRGYIHGKKAKLGEWNVVGMGGSNKTPFHTPSEQSEEEIEATFEKAGVDKFSIVLCHPPPQGVFDSVGGTHVGSAAVRKMVEQKKPLLLLCGHIHEYEGKEILFSTLIVKLGAAQNMRAAEIEIGDDIDVKFISL